MSFHRSIHQHRSSSSSRLPGDLPEVIRWSRELLDWNQRTDHFPRDRLRLDRRGLGSQRHGRHNGKHRCGRACAAQVSGHAVPSGDHGQRGTRGRCCRRKSGQGRRRSSGRRKEGQPWYVFWRTRARECCPAPLFLPISTLSRLRARREAPRTVRVAGHPARALQGI